MIRSTSRVGRQPTPWLFFVSYLRKCLRLRHIFIASLFCILFVCLRLTHQLPSDQKHAIGSTATVDDGYHMLLADYHIENCTSNGTESVFHDLSSDESDPNDTRPRPSIARLNSLFSKLISYEEKFLKIFSYLGIFRFTDLLRTLHPFTNDTQRFQDISCFLQRYINVSEAGRIDVAPNLISYLKQVSAYLSEGFTHQHSVWNATSAGHASKPVIVLAANNRFFDTMQASMRTVDQYLRDHRVVIYDLGFDTNQLSMVREVSLKIRPFDHPGHLDTRPLSTVFDHSISIRSD